MMRDFRCEAREVQVGDELHSDEVGRVEVVEIEKVLPLTRVISDDGNHLKEVKPVIVFTDSRKRRWWAKPNEYVTVFVETVQTA